MPEPILCARCGAALPVHAAFAATTCAFCGTTSAPRPRVVERVVERVVVVAAEAPEQESGLPGCPRCAKSMTPVQGGGVEVLACAKCGGALLTPDQLSALQRARNDELARAVLHVSLVYGRIPPRSAVLSCPTCQGPLRMEEIEGSVHLVHVCDAHGTFFEQEALNTYMDLWTERRAGEIDDETLEAMGVGRKGLFGFFRR